MCHYKSGQFWCYFVRERYFWASGANVSSVRFIVFKKTKIVEVVVVVAVVGVV